MLYSVLLTLHGCHNSTDQTQVAVINGSTCKKMSTVSMIASPLPRGLCNLLPFSKPLDKPIVNYLETELLFKRVTGVPFLPK